MISFCISIIALIPGYFVYGKIVERVFPIDSNQPTSAAMVFFDNVEGRNTAMSANNNNAAWAANEISINMLGKVGGVLALLGIVAAPITSGDTAFRSARIIVADIFELDQKSLQKRLYICLPLFVIAFGLTQMDLAIIWRYLAWSNQTLAAVVLWTITAYLMYEKKAYLITLLPAVFMTMVCSTENQNKWISFRTPNTRVVKFPTS